MSTLDAHGLSVDVPSGWEGRIFRRLEAGEARAADVPGAVAAQGERTFPVLHAATIALPADAADFGSDVVPDLGPNDAFVVLKEFDPTDAAQPLFQQHVGLPDRLDSDDFDPSALQRRLDGQAGRQVFFNEAGRAFCLYVVLGDYARRDTVVESVNRIIETIRISPLES